jgi:excisionase family DNA binding protein
MLTVKEVLQEFKISRSTFDRWRAKGLKVYQDKQGSAVRIKRVDVLKFIKN